MTKVRDLILKKKGKETDAKEDKRTKEKGEKESGKSSVLWKLLSKRKK